MNTEINTAEAKAVFARFIGGQMEVQNHGKADKPGYIYRGQIESVELEGGRLQVKFTWIAKGEGSPAPVSKWVKGEWDNYTIDLDFYSDLAGQGGCLCLNSMAFGNTIIFHPPGDSHPLDPAQVKDF